MYFTTPNGTSKYTDKLELKEAANGTLTLVIPAADPPVIGTITSHSGVSNCTGEAKRPSDCNMNVYVGNSGNQYINVSLAFVAYPTWTKRIPIGIKGRL